MSPRPATFQHLLLRVLRHLLLALDAVFGARVGELRARLEALPVGHRRRARLMAEIRRLARVRAMLAEPGVLDDPAFRGKEVEVARVRNDAGRRALARRRLHGARYVGLRGAAEHIVYVREEGRCSRTIAVAFALSGTCPRGVVWHAQVLARTPLSGVRLLCFGPGSALVAGSSRANLLLIGDYRHFSSC